MHTRLWTCIPVLGDLREHGSGVGGLDSKEKKKPFSRCLFFFFFFFTLLLFYFRSFFFRIKKSKSSYFWAERQGSVLTPSNLRITFVAVVLGGCSIRRACGTSSDRCRCRLRGLQYKGAGPHFYLLLSGFFLVDSLICLSRLPVPPYSAATMTIPVPPCAVLIPSAPIA